MAAGQRHDGPAERGRPPSAGGGIPDGLLIGSFVLLLGLLGLMWSATGLAGLLAHGAWPDNLAFMRTPQALRQLVTEPQDLAGAWPSIPKDQLSGYGLFWGIVIGELMVLIVLTIFVVGTLARYRTVRARRRAARAQAAEAKRLGLTGAGAAKGGTETATHSGTRAEPAAGVEAQPSPARGPGSGSAAPEVASGTAGPSAESTDGAPVSWSRSAAPGPTQAVSGNGAVAPVTGHPETEAVAARAATGTGPEPHPRIAEQRASVQDAPAEGVPTPPVQDGAYAPLHPTAAQQLPTARTGPLTVAGLPDGESVRSRVLFGAQRGESAVHTVLEAVGPVLVVTSDPKLWAATKDVRAKFGPTHVFDPSHLLDTPVRLRWNPAADCGSREIAAARATALLAPVRPAHAMDRPMAEAAETMLRCWLHAAAVDGRPFRHVHRWAQGNSAHEPVRILRTHPKAAGGAAGELEATLTAHRERRDMAQELTARALGALSSIHIRDACNPGRADTLALESFVAEGGTLYLMGESIEDPRTQPGAMPFLTALASHVVEHGRRMAERSSSGRLDPPLTLVLDDVAAVAPLPALPDLLAQGAAQGLPTLALMRSQEQARARWPHRSLVSHELG